MKFTNDAAIARFIVRSSDRADELFGKDIVEQAQVFSGHHLIEILTDPPLCACCLVGCVFWF